MKLKTKILLSSLFLASTLSATAFVACSFNRITNLAEIQKTDLGYEIILIGDSNWSFRGEYAYGIRGLSDDSYGDWIQNQTIRSEKQKAISFLKDVTDLEKVLGETKNEKDEWSSNKNERAKWTENFNPSKIEQLLDFKNYDYLFIKNIDTQNIESYIYDKNDNFYLKSFALEDDTLIFKFGFKPYKPEDIYVAATPRSKSYFIAVEKNKIKDFSFEKYKIKVSGFRSDEITE